MLNKLIKTIYRFNFSNLIILPLGQSSIGYISGEIKHSKMQIIQKAPQFIGKSALQNSAIYALDIVGITTIQSFYSRPRDTERYTFVEILLGDNYFDSDEGNFLSSGNNVYFINPTTKETIPAIIVSSESISPTQSKTTVKSLNSSISTISTSWKLILSCGVDWSQTINECPEIQEFRASSITHNSVKLTWRPAFKSEINYIRIKEESGTNWIKVHEVQGSIGVLTINALTPNTTYQCQITNRCEYNKSNFYSDSITFKTNSI